MQAWEIDPSRRGTQTNIKANAATTECHPGFE
jgi:hypothetical protein